MDQIVAAYQMQMPIPNVVGPKELAGRYKSVTAPQVAFQGQANDLTQAGDVQLAGRIQVIAANAALFDHWEAVGGAKAGPQGGAQAPLPPPNGAGGMAAIAAQQQAMINRARPKINIPVQMSGDHVSVATHESQAPVVKIEKGRVTGDQGVIQSYAAADRLYRMESEYLGRDITFPTRDGKLHVEVGNFGALHSGPAHTEGTIAMPPGDKFSPRDPDVIGHEGGHAVLRAQHPEYDTHPSPSPEADALHEGFADSTALIASLRDKGVRADVIEKRKQGSLSNMASNIAEGTKRHYGTRQIIDPDQPPPKDGQFPVTKEVWPDARQGLRDLADAPPRPGEARKRSDGSEDPHHTSMRFSTSFYRSVLDISDDLKQKNPGMSDDAALKRATDIAGKDLARGTDFLPVLPGGGTQDDLARAVVSADRRDHGGVYGEIYAKNFNAGGLESEPPALRPGMDGIRLPGRVAASKPFEVKEGMRRPVAGSDRAVADQFVKDNATALQLEKGVTYKAQQMYRNDQGETFMMFSDGKHSTDEAAKHYLRMGFDRDGNVIHESRANLTPQPPPAPQFAA